MRNQNFRLPFCGKIGGNPLKLLRGWMVGLLSKARAESRPHTHWLELAAVLRFTASMVPASPMYISKMSVVAPIIDVNRLLCTDEMQADIAAGRTGEIAQMKAKTNAAL
ncbi:hypothetical protein HDV05_004055, partial [Chytridiales sp. JEL 0842]